jgi:hypothetical protein
LPHSEPPSRRADRHQGASITPIAVRSTLLRITADSPSTASRVRWVDAATHREAKSGRMRHVTLIGEATG